MRAMVALLGVVVAASLVLGATGAVGVGDGEDAVQNLTAADRARGAAIYQRNCAACHGQRGQGRQGAGITAGPALHQLDIANVDLVLRTGRMPIVHLPSGVREDQLEDHDRLAVVGWMQERFALPGQIPTIGEGEAGRGLDVYVRHCAACHGTTGGGGVAGGSTLVPDIRGSDGVVVAEAVRVGPFAMPAFPEEVLGDDELGDLFAYLDAVDEAPRTLAGLREINPVASALATLVLGIGLVAALLGITRSTPDDADEGVPNDTVDADGNDT